MQCRDCGADITSQRNGKSKRGGLCSSCGRRRRLAVYFRQYYLKNRESVLAKNRKWAEDNKERVSELRKMRASTRPRPVRVPVYCIDCGDQVVRAQRSRRCYVRHRYATDTNYRTRSLETTRRWVERQRAKRAAEENAVVAETRLAAS